MWSQHRLVARGDRCRKKFLQVSGSLAWSGRSCEVNLICRSAEQRLGWTLKSDVRQWRLQRRSPMTCWTGQPRLAVRRAESALERDCCCWPCMGPSQRARDSECTKQMLRRKVTMAPRGLQRTPPRMNESQAAALAAYTTPEPPPFPPPHHTTPHSTGNNGNT
jgi:hypothetical protein